MTYYKVTIDKSAKSAGSKAPAGEGYQLYDQVSKEVDTIEKAQEFIREHIPAGCKRQPIYFDGKDGEAVHCGYIYSFTNRDYSHDSKPWYEQAWVNVFKIESEVVNPREWGKL